MASAVDIITYVGIPLAVVGVLPTIYTAWKSFLTLRQVERLLHSNGVSATTRSALLSGIVEVEIPRRSIIPLDRSDPKYFGLRSTPSRLKGGTWMLFEWKELAIGTKSYRLQYHDELAQPQAEIDFEALVAFLLDRGAVPNSAGWADLRGAGLWTPAGTKLLMSPIGDEEVLSVALSDDSDGRLSLSLNWKQQWDIRSKDSLPPYWVRVKPPEAEHDVLAKLNDIETASKGDGSPEVVKNGGFLDDDSAASEDVPLHAAISVRISATGVQESHSGHESKQRLRLHHLQPPPPSPTTTNTAGFWFCCAATAFQAPQGGLWSFSIPADVFTLARQHTVPGGVMVLLEILTDEEVPAWRTPRNDQAQRLDRQIKFQQQAQAAMEESRMPPAQRDAARKSRMEREARDFHNDFRRQLMAQEQQKEAELLEALQSRRVRIQQVASANFRFLERRLKMDAGRVTQSMLLEQILHGMLQQPAFAHRLALMLDLWKNWALSGGMTKSHFLAVEEDQTTFALASCVLGAIAELVNEPMGTGSLVGDLQECLRMWRKVRLG